MRQRCQGCGVERRVLDEETLEEVAQRREPGPQAPLAHRLRDSLSCSGPRLKRVVLRCVPVLSWLPRYSFRDYALGDLVSGISVGIMHLPQGMAYALLASVPPVFGLYSSLYPFLVYFIFGTSRHISIGTFAVVSIMVGGVTERVAPDHDFLVNGTNGSGVIDIAARDAQRVQVAAAATVLAGIFQVVLGLVRFGFVVTYLSEPLVRGYTTAAATYVVISQLKYIFGIHPKRHSGPLALVYILIDVCRLLPETNVATLVVSVVSLVVLVTSKELNAMFSHKLPLPIPIELITLGFPQAVPPLAEHLRWEGGTGLRGRSWLLARPLSLWLQVRTRDVLELRVVVPIVVGTLVSNLAWLYPRYGVEVVGMIPSGLKPPSPPNVSLFREVIGDAFALAIVGYAISISLGKTFALKHGYKVDSNQELVALGLSNTFGGFFQCYSVCSSMSRSLIQESTGGKTQIAGLVSSGIVLITVLKLGSLFQELPKAVLSAIVFANLRGMFRQYGDICMLWRTSRVDLHLRVGTHLTPSLSSNLPAPHLCSTQFACSLISLLSPRFSALGQIPGTEIYLDVETYSEAREIPGITIFHSSTTMYFANADMYLEALKEKSGIDIGKLLLYKKKLEATQRRREKREQRRAQREAKRAAAAMHAPPPGHARQPVVFTVEKDAELWREKEGSLQSRENGTVFVVPKSAKAQATWEYLKTGDPDTTTLGSASELDGDTTTLSSDDTLSRDLERLSIGSLGKWTWDIHSIILDLSTANFIDTVGIKTLRNIFLDFGEIDVDVYMTGCQACVLEQLERGDFFTQSITKARLFTSVHDAVLYCLSHRGGALIPSYDTSSLVSPMALQHSDRVEE
ncbi:S26A6 protein, partial [Atractosteus spatula]|nr:S26A6 protein [Atractosteus spatula]